MKNEVRERVTFTNKDSSYDDAVVGTLTDCCHVLNAFTDKELTILSKSAEGYNQKEIINNLQKH